MRYFLISSGLRGGYLYDSSYAIKAATRRELREALQSEADFIASGFTVYGLSKAAIASLAAAAWRDWPIPRAYLPRVLPYSLQRGGSRSYGLFVDGMTRSEYREAMAAEEV